MESFNEIEECAEGPGEFEYMSKSYVWGSPELNIGVHFVPLQFTHEELQLGTVTRAVYHTLETVQGGLHTEGCFVMVHYVSSTKNVHVTMLPVGNEEIRARLDEELKNGKVGFSNLLQTLKTKIEVGGKPNGVFILYNSPEDLNTPTKVAIVHEMGASLGVDADEFLQCIGKGTNSH